jgi:hypothetical protein
MTQDADFASGTKRPLPILGEYARRQIPSNAANRLMRVSNRGLVVQRQSHTALLLVSTVFSPHGWIAPQASAPRAQATRSGAVAGADSEALIFCCYGAQRRCLKPLGPG